MSDESEVLATMVVTIAALRSRAEAAERHAEALAGALNDTLRALGHIENGCDCHRCKALAAYQGEDR